MNEFEELWDRLLSRDPGRILAAYHSLQPDEQEFILKHLGRMITEEGWQVSQTESAKAALEAINNPPADEPGD